MALKALLYLCSKPVKCEQALIQAHEVIQYNNSLWESLSDQD